MALTEAEEIAISRNLRRGLEWIMTCGPFFMGLFFIAWPDVFAPKLYEPIRFLSSDLVGAIYLLLGSTRAAFLWVNGHYWPSPRVRWWYSLATLCLLWVPMVMLFWTQAVLDIVKDGMFLPGVVGFPLLALLETACLYWLGIWIAHRRREGGYE